MTNKNKEINYNIIDVDSLGINLKESINASKFTRG
jgi:hypothetical protein